MLASSLPSRERGRPKGQLANYSKLQRYEKVKFENDGLDLWSRLLTFDKADASIALFSLNRNLDGRNDDEPDSIPDLWSPTRSLSG